MAADGLWYKRRWQVWINAIDILREVRGLQVKLTLVLTGFKTLHSFFVLPINFQT
jgi:hypothetical protein